MQVRDLLGIRSCVVHSSTCQRSTLGSNLINPGPTLDVGIVLLKCNECIRTERSWCQYYSPLFCLLLLLPALTFICHFIHVQQFLHLHPNATLANC